MDEIEMAPLENVQKPGEIQVSPTCWRCHKGAEKRKLLCLCKCRELRQTNNVMHVHCMEEMANTQDINYCPSCFAYYPLRRKRKTVSNMLWKVHAAFFMIIFMLILYLIHGSLMIWMVIGQNTHTISIFMKILAIIIYIWFIFASKHIIIERYKSIYQFIHRWARGKYEWKYDKSYVIKNKRKKINKRSKRKAVIKKKR